MDRPRRAGPDPQALGILLRVNGATKQDSSTANMVSGMRGIMAHYLKVFVRAGDVVEAAVTGNGTVRTRMAPAEHKVVLFDATASQPPTR